MDSPATRGPEDYFTRNRWLLEWRSIVFDPSPALLFSACLALGCAASSFAHRRQGSYMFRGPALFSALIIAMAGGTILNLNADTIMLSAIPWAVFSAMLISVVLENVLNVLLSYLGLPSEKLGQCWNRYDSMRRSNFSYDVEGSLEPIRDKFEECPNQCKIQKYHMRLYWRRKDTAEKATRTRC